MPLLSVIFELLPIDDFFPARGIQDCFNECEHGWTKKIETFNKMGCYWKLERFPVDLNEEN